MLFDYNIEHYNFNDLKKLFNVKEGEKMSSEEMDMRIESIRFSASQTTQDESELVHVANFLKVAKEKYRIYEKTEQIQYNNIYPMTEDLSERMKDNKMLDRNSHAIIEHTPDIGIPMEFKYVNIHSSDRDSVSWSRASNFEIELPDALKDVRSVSLYDYNFNGFICNFSDFYQNVTLYYKIGDVEKEVKIDNGYYSDVDLMDVIIEKMNEERTGDQFSYTIRNPTKKIEIKFTSAFTISFQRADKTTKDQKEGIYDQDENWGLGYYLGLEKESNSSVDNTITGILRPFLDFNVYLEIDGFNHVMQTRKMSGMVNSYFSRIPLRNGLGNDVGGFERAVISKERVSKLRIKLRFHNGMIVDFLQNQNFDFTLMFECKK